MLDFIRAEDLAQRFPGVTVQPPQSDGFGLADELIRGATVPQFGESRRQCSPKFKHQGQDQWVMDHALGYGLSQDLIEGGIVPQFVQNRRRCSAKFKSNACEQWLDSEDESPPPSEIFVAIGFTVGEERRRDRGDLAEAKRASQPKPSWVKRTNFYPLIDQFKLDRAGTEAYAKDVVAKGIEPWWRSACVYCPFSGIAGPKEEVLFKHRQCPAEAGFALLVEHLARRLNPKQTLYPNGRSLFQMLKDDGNQGRPRPPPGPP